MKTNRSVDHIKFGRYRGTIKANGRLKCWRVTIPAIGFWEEEWLDADDFDAAKYRVLKKVRAALKSR